MFRARKFLNFHASISPSLPPSPLLPLNLLSPPPLFPLPLPLLPPPPPSPPPPSLPLPSSPPPLSSPPLPPPPSTSLPPSPSSPPPPPPHDHTEAPLPNIGKGIVSMQQSQLPGGAASAVQGRFARTVRNGILAALVMLTAVGCVPIPPAVEITGNTPTTSDEAAAKCPPEKITVTDLTWFQDARRRVAGGGLDQQRVRSADQPDRHRHGGRERRGAGHRSRRRSACIP